MLPLAINRFFRLYLPKSYGNFFGRFKMLLFLFIHDVFVCLFIYVKRIFKNNVIMEQVFMFLVMACSIVLSICILVKIHQMRKMAHGIGENSSTLNDLFRAALVCLIQPLCSLVYLIMVFGGISLFVQIDSLKVEDVPNLSVQIYVIYGNIYTLVYDLMVVVETSLLLIVLKTYRLEMLFILNKILPWKINYSSSSIVFLKTTKHVTKI
jgi:hypothetical protein